MYVKSALVAVCNDSFGVQLNVLSCACDKQFCDLAAIPLQEHKAVQLHIARYSYSWHYTKYCCLAHELRLGAH